MTDGTNGEDPSEATPDEAPAHPDGPHEDDPDAVDDGDTAGSPADEAADREDHVADDPGDADATTEDTDADTPADETATAVIDEGDASPREPDDPAQDAGTPPWYRRLIPTPWFFAEAAIYAVVIWQMLPRPLNYLTSRVIGTGDAEYAAWYGWKLKELLFSGERPTYIPDVVYPDGVRLVLGDGYLSAALSGFWNIFAAPVLAFNLAIITALAANFVAGRYLGKMLAPERRSLWIVCALAIGTAPMIGIRVLGHPFLLLAAPSILVVTHVLRAAYGRGRIRPIVLGLLLFLAYLASIYWLVSAGIVVLAVLLTRAFQGSPGRRDALRIGLSFLIVVILMTPFLTARLDFVSAERNSPENNGLQVLDNQRNSVGFSADALSVIAQPIWAKWKLPGTDRLSENFQGNILEWTVFPGYAALVALILLAFIRHPLRWPIVGSAATMWILSLGPSLRFDGRMFRDSEGEPRLFMPMEMLYHVPGLDSLRTPTRIAVMFTTLGAAALVIVLSRLLPRITSRVGQGAVITAVVASIGLNLLSGLPTSTLGASPQVEAAFREMKDDPKSETMMDVPFDAGGQWIQVVKFQIQHRRPLLGYQGTHSGLPWYSGFTRYKQSRALAVARCLPQMVGYSWAPWPADLPSDGNELQELRRDFGVRYFLVNKRQLAEAHCDARRGIVESVVQQGELMAEDELWAVYRTPDPVTAANP